MYLFEGHLTVDPEPPQPQWLAHSNLLNAAASLYAAESSYQRAAEFENPSEDASTLLQSLIENLDDILPPVLTYHFRNFKLCFCLVNLLCWS